MPIVLWLELFAIVSVRALVTSIAIYIFVHELPFKVELSWLCLEKTCTQFHNLGWIHTIRLVFALIALYISEASNTSEIINSKNAYQTIQTTRYEQVIYKLHTSNTLSMLTACGIHFHQIVVPKLHNSSNSSQSY